MPFCAVVQLSLEDVTAVACWQEISLSSTPAAYGWGSKLIEKSWLLHTNRHHLHTPQLIIDNNSSSIAVIRARVSNTPTYSSSSSSGVLLLT